MKAYKATGVYPYDDVSTVVFAESASKAKVIASHTDMGEDLAYTEIRVCRFPEMDSRYNGREEMDWYDPEDRKALVECGWTCEETSWECDKCNCKPLCRHWEQE